jgi:hypothetical protein
MFINFLKVGEYKGYKDPFTIGLERKRGED